MLRMLDVPIWIITVALFFFVSRHLLGRSASSGSIVLLLTVYLALVLSWGLLAVCGSFKPCLREILIVAASSFDRFVESHIERIGKGALSPHRGNRRCVPSCVEPLDLLNLVFTRFSSGHDWRGRGFYHYFSLDTFLSLLLLPDLSYHCHLLDIVLLVLELVLESRLSFNGFLGSILSESIFKAFLIPHECVVQSLLDSCVHFSLNCFFVSF